MDGRTGRTLLKLWKAEVVVAEVVVVVVGIYLSQIYNRHIRRYIYVSYVLTP